MKRIVLGWMMLGMIWLGGCQEDSLSVAPAKPSTREKKPMQTESKSERRVTMAELRSHPEIAEQGVVIVTGEVLKTEEAAAYTYIHFKDETGEMDAAVPKLTLQVGEKIDIRVEMVMLQFQSKTLNKMFDFILFGQILGAGSPGLETLPAGHPPFGEGTEQPAAHPPSAETPPATVSLQDIAKAEGDNGYRIAEIYRERKKLQGTPVRVRGKVVKFTAGVLKKNWLHLQDGSGNAAENNHDLTVTTQAQARVGDCLVIEGNLVLEKDFGYGYAYAVIVEEANVIEPPSATGQK